jgi:integrase
LQLAELLQQWRATAPYPAEDNWLFANQAKGKPYHQDQIQKKHLKTVAVKARLGSNIGWHTFRHTYRSWLGETGAPMTVQEELMRTMNVYGKAMTATERQANRKVVEIDLASPRRYLPEGV